MKKKTTLIIEIALIIIFFSSCLSTEPTRTGMSGLEKLQNKHAREQAEFDTRQAKGKELFDQERQLLEKEGFPIAILEYRTDAPNSAGGVNVFIRWQNISSKPIKYITFSVTPYNAVDDAVSCTISNKGKYRLKATGPMEAKTEKIENNFWENVWYNSTIKRAEINSIDIIYMDNSEESISGDKALEMFVDQRAIYQSVKANYPMYYNK